MSDRVLTLWTSLQELPAEEQTEITHRVWDSLPNIREDLFTYYEPEQFEDVRDRVEDARGPKGIVLSVAGVMLRDQVLSLGHDDRIEITHLLWQALPTMYGMFGEDDPAFIAELDRRMADFEAGRTKAIPAEEVMARLREKYG